MRSLTKHLVLATAIAAFFAGCGFACAAEETAAALTAEAAQILDVFPAADGAHNAAAEKLRQALALDSGYAKAYVQVGRLQIAGGPEFGRQFAGVSAESASRAIMKALELDPGHAPAVCALAELLVADGRSEEALQLLARIPEDEHTIRIAAAARLAQRPADNYEAELDALLVRVKTDEEARQQYVDILAVMGPDDPRTSQYRRLLASRLY